MLHRALFIMVAVAAVAVAGCGGGSGGSSTPSPTATPALTPGPIVVSPSALTLSKAAGSLTTGVSVSQVNATSGISVTGGTNCWALPAVTTTILASQPNASSGLTPLNGTINGSYGYFIAQNIGTCTVTFTGSNQTTNLVVTVGP